METREKKLQKMIDMQYKLNTATCGEDWIESEVCKKTGKKISWEAAIIDEVSELLESINPYHWKNKPVDMQNAKVEVVDIWHFLMSITIAKYSNPKEVLIELLTEQKAPNSENKINDITEFVGSICSISIQLRLAVRQFSRIMSHFGMSFDDLYNMYTMKNWLNEFRVKNGYAEGTYRKMIEVPATGKIVEDNAFLMYYMDKGWSFISAKELFTMEYNANRGAG